MFLVNESKNDVYILKPKSNHSTLDYFSTDMECEEILEMVINASDKIPVRDKTDILMTKANSKSELKINGHFYNLLRCEELIGEESEIQIVYDFAGGPTYTNQQYKEKYSENYTELTKNIFKGQIKCKPIKIRLEK